MADITKLKKRLEQNEVERQNIQTALSESTRKAANSRKFELAVHLLKLAETDSDAHATLVKVWALAKAKRPNPFKDADMPQAPKGRIKND